MDVFAHTNVFLPCAPIARLFVICASVIYSFLLLMYATSVATEPLYCLNESRSFVSRVRKALLDLPISTPSLLARISVEYLVSTLPAAFCAVASNYACKDSAVCFNVLLKVLSNESY